MKYKIRINKRVLKPEISINDAAYWQKRIKQLVPTSQVAVMPAIKSNSVSTDMELHLYNQVAK